MGAAGKASLPHLYSQPGSQDQMPRAKRTPLQLLLSRPSDFLAEILNLKSLNILYLNQSLSRGQKQLLRLPQSPPLTLHPSASPLSPTS